MTGLSARAALELEPETPVMLVFGGSQARAPAERGRCRGAAAARRDDDHRPPDRRAGLRRGAQAPRRHCRPSCRFAIGRSRSCARRWPTRSSRPTCSLAAPAHRRWPRPVRSGCRWSWCPIRMPPAHQIAQRARAGRCGRRAHRRRRGLRRQALLGACRRAAARRAGAGDDARRGTRLRPAAAPPTPSPSWCWPSPNAAELPGGGRHRRRMSRAAA